MIFPIRNRQEIGSQGIKMKCRCSFINIVYLSPSPFFLPRPSPTCCSAPHALGQCCSSTKLNTAGCGGTGVSKRASGDR